MPDFTTAQWVFAGLIVVGLLLSVAPTLWNAIKHRLPDLPEWEPDPADELMERMARLAKLQADLEARGHDREAEQAGQWYPLLRKPAKEVES